MSDVVVYTAITGNNGDAPRAPLLDPKDWEGVDFVCFTDQKFDAPPPWQLRPPACRHPTNSRRTSRYHKMHPHLLFPDANSSIWLDGSEQLRIAPRKLVNKYLLNTDFATFRHPQRNTVGKEVAACIRLRKDKTDTLVKHLNRYRREGFKDKAGLFETAIVIRRHTEKIAQLNEAWWRELSTGSLRDQVSLPYVVSKTGTKITRVAGHRFCCPYLKHWPHRRR